MNRPTETRLSLIIAAIFFVGWVCTAGAMHLLGLS